jgi:hypothetical protein
MQSTAQSRFLRVADSSSPTRLLILSLVEFRETLNKPPQKAATN